MMNTIFYSYLVCVTVVAWCQAEEDNSFVHGPNITSNVQCVLVKKRNKSHYSTQLRTNQTDKSCLLTFNDPNVAIFKLAGIRATNVVDFDIKLQSNTSNQQINKTRWVWANKCGLDFLSMFEIKQFLKMETADRNLATRSLNVGRETVQLAVWRKDILVRKVFAKSANFQFYSRRHVDKRNESHLSPQLETNQSQPCVVTFNDSGISAVLKLARNKIINIVEIDIKFQWNLRKNQISKTHWVWTNGLGLEILSLSQELLKMKMTGYLATKSLNVGRQAAQLAVLENPSKCVLKENSNDFLAMKLLKRLSFSGYESELCYKTQIDTWWCCKIKSFNYDKNGCVCSPRSGKSNFVSRFKTLCKVIVIFFFVGGNLLAFCMGLYFSWQSECTDKWYHELNESPMSLSALLSMLFWDECGLPQSVLRRVLLASLVCCLLCIERSYILLFLWCFVFVFQSLLTYVLSRCKSQSDQNILEVCAFIFTLLLFNCSLYVLYLVVISPVFGAFLNILYFFPYITSISVFVFYLFNFWRSLEAKYFILKALIYEVIKDINNDSNSNHDKDSSSNNCDDEIVCVVSKDLYDKIRERLLPYRRNLVYFAWTFSVMLCFSYVTLSLIKIFQASDVSPAVQMLTSLSFGAVPYLLNIVVLRKGDEEKAAWKEQLRVRVMQQVIKLKTENTNFLRILLKKSPNENENGDKSSVTEKEKERLINGEAEGSSGNGIQIVQYESSV